MKFLHLALGVLSASISFSQAYRPAQIFDDLQLRDDPVNDELITDYLSTARLAVRDTALPLLSERELLDNLALRYFDSVDYPVRRHPQLYYDDYPSTRGLVEDVYESRGFLDMFSKTEKPLKVKFTSDSDRNQVLEFDMERSATVADLNAELLGKGYSNSPFYSYKRAMKDKWKPLTNYDINGELKVTDFPLEDQRR